MRKLLAHNQPPTPEEEEKGKEEEQGGGGLCVTKGTGEKSPLLLLPPFCIGARGVVEKLDKKSERETFVARGTACAVEEEEEGARARGKLESSSFEAGRKTQRHSAKQQ